MMTNPKANPVTSAAAATRLWRRYGFGTIENLVLEDLAMALGIVVLDGDLKAADAWLVRKKDSGIIRVSKSIPEPGRRRFAIAHELGHWQLHREISQLVSCTNADMVSSYKASSPELEANAFAAELIMPRHLFAPAMSESRPTAKFVNHLADLFGTTRTSVAYRIADLSTDYFAFVMSKDGVITWWQASEPLRELIWIDSGEEIPDDSVAAQVFRNESVSGIPEKIDVESWFSQNRGLRVSYIYEDIIHMPSYGQVLSLLWLE